MEFGHGPSWTIKGDSENIIHHQQSVASDINMFYSKAKIVLTLFLNFYNLFNSGNHYRNTSKELNLVLWPKICQNHSLENVVFQSNNCAEDLSLLKIIQRNASK